MRKPAIRIEDPIVDSASVVAGLQRIKESAWDLYEQSRHMAELGTPARQALKDSITTAALALREVRGALQVEAALIVPKQEEPDETNELAALLQLELKANPALVAHALSNMPKSDLRALLLSVAPDIVDSPTDGAGRTGMVSDGRLLPTGEHNGTESK